VPVGALSRAAAGAAELIERDGRTWHEEDSE
jgi:hypothetical protein